MLTATALVLAALLTIGPRTGAAERVGALARRGRLRAGVAAPADATVRSPTPARPAAAAVVGGAVAVPAFGAWLLGGWVLGAAGLVAGGVGAVLIRDRAARRRDESARTGALAAVHLIAAELSAGSTPPDALSAAAEIDPSHGELWRVAADRLRADGGVGEELAASPDPTVFAVGHAWRIAVATGAPLSGVLARIAGDLTAIAERRRSLDAAIAGPRASAFLLAVLPLLGIGLGAALGARPWEFLVGDRTGRVVCIAGVVLDALGVLWIRRVLARAVAP